MTKATSRDLSLNGKSIYDDDPRYNLLKKWNITKDGEIRLSSKELDKKFEEQLDILHENINTSKTFYSDIALKVNAKCVTIDDGTLNVVFDNAIRNITDLVDPTLPSIYRATATIQSLIEEPNKYLNLKVKNEIFNMFGEITPANTFAFLRNHFNNKYSNRVDLIIMEWRPQLVYN